MKKEKLNDWEMVPQAM